MVLKQLVERSDAGTIAIFPEGTRSKTGKPKEFSQTGLKILCKNAPSAYVVPVSINNSWKIVKYGFFPVGLGNRLTFTVHKPLAVSEFDFAEIESEPSHAVAALAVKHAPVRYECQLREVIQLSTLPLGGTVALLDVKSIYVDDRLWNGQMIDQQLLDSVGKMGGDFYSLTNYLRQLERP